MDAHHVLISKRFYSQLKLNLPGSSVLVPIYRFIKHQPNVHKNYIKPRWSSVVLSSKSGADDEVLPIALNLTRNKAKSDCDVATSTYTKGNLNSNTLIIRWVWQLVVYMEVFNATIIDN